MAAPLKPIARSAKQSRRDRWETLLELIPGVTFEQRADLSFAFIGPGRERLFGDRANDLADRPDLFLSCIHEDDRVSYLSWMKKSASDSGVTETTYRLIHPDTRELLHVADIRKKVGRDPVLFQGVWMDRTSQIRAEKRLAYRAWKETVSTVTSGLLHDFNNVVAGIFSLSELYHSLLEPGHEMHAGIGQIKASSMEAQKLVRRIMELNREESGEKSLFNLETLIADQLDFLKAVLPRGTRIEDRFSGGELPVRLDGVGFRQVLLNLATNARDAFREKGRIEIITRRHDVPSAGPAGIIPNGFHYPAGSVEIIFKDNGCGMPPGVAERVFDPFFSTKEPTKGSGLGLYNAHLFAEANKGRIGVVTAQGSGTAFHLVLPLETFGESPECGTASPAESDVRRHLLVYSWEDADPSDLVARMREAGWQVLTLTQADRALEHLGQSIFPVDLVVIMRITLDGNADQLLSRIRAERPEVKITVITMGDDPEQLPRTISGQADLVLHHNLKLSTMMKRLSALMGDPP